MDWQPISTAPKDGTEVLLWIPANGEDEAGCVVCAYERPSWYDGEPGWFAADDYQLRPTHWMPLPPPPLDR